MNSKTLIAVGGAAAATAAAFLGILWLLGHGSGGCRGAAPDSVFAQACKQGGGEVKEQDCSYKCSVDVPEAAMAATAQQMLKGVDACNQDSDCAVDVCAIGRCGFAFNKERWSALEDARRHLPADPCEAMDCDVEAGAARCVTGHCTSAPVSAGGTRKADSPP
jgi:hypothetical protein